MGRFVTIPINAISVTNDADQDILELIAGATWPFKLWSFELNASILTGEVVNMQLISGRTTTGSGGGAITPANVNRGDTSTVRTTVNSLVTTPGSGGTVLRGLSWSQLDRFEYLPLPEARYEIPSATRLSLHLSTAVSTTRVWSGEMIIEEFG